MSLTQILMESGGVFRVVLLSTKLNRPLSSPSWPDLPGTKFWKKTHTRASNLQGDVYAT